MKKEPIVTLTMDDCWKGQAKTIGEELDQHALRGTFYVISNLVGRRVGQLDFEDWDEIRRLHRNGHEIGSHSYSHRAAPTDTAQRMGRLLRLIRYDGVRGLRRLRVILTESSDEYDLPHLSIANEILDSKQQIESTLGSTCDSYSYPAGSFTLDVKRLVREAGYKSARSSNLGYNSQSRVERYALRVQVWDKFVTSKEANKWLDLAIERDYWLVEVFHALGSGDYLYGSDQREVSKHLSYIASRKNEIENLNPTAVLRDT
jgi:peptidoglycan/xylan/chitin deacetylase (PgdA/CDA1 family)